VKAIIVIADRALEINIGDRLISLRSVFCAADRLMVADWAAVSLIVVQRSPNFHHDGPFIISCACGCRGVLRHRIGPWSLRALCGRSL